jgi:hypothetical protein
VFGDDPWAARAYTHCRAPGRRVIGASGLGFLRGRCSCSQRRRTACGHLPWLSERIGRIACERHELAAGGTTSWAAFSPNDVRPLEPAAPLATTAAWGDGWESAACEPVAAKRLDQERVRSDHSAAFGRRADPLARDGVPEPDRALRRLRPRHAPARTDPQRLDRVGPVLVRSGEPDIEFGNVP